VADDQGRGASAPSNGQASGLGAFKHTEIGLKVSYAGPASDNNYTLTAEKEEITQTLRSLKVEKVYDQTFVGAPGKQSQTKVGRYIIENVR